MTKTQKTTTSIVRISPLAKKHLQRVVDLRRAAGFSASGAAILNDLILSIPLPEREPLPQEKNP